ncbi:retrovirus-related pol polyprotein from transposon TNT 1-94 [Tanacetum coccineum]
MAHLNLQLKHQYLKENIENFKSKSSKDVPESDAFLNSVNGMIRFKSLDSQNLHLTKTITALQEQLEHFKDENEKVKHHYQELFNSIKITRVKTIERTTSLQTEIENLKTQLKGKMPCVISNVESPKVSIFEKYAIEVESIPQSQRNNRDVHHHYLNRLRDTLDTLREIVEKARSKRPSDHSQDYACVYTKRKKHVTFAGSLETSINNTTNHVKQLIVQKTNVPIIHSTGVSNATKARKSQSKSNKMNDKTFPANSVLEKKVEYHHKKNKSKLSKKNHVDSSTSIRRTVFNTNSNSLCKTCNECIISFNHDKCVENSLKSSKPPPVRKIWRVKQVKQTWKPTGKVFTTVGYHWKPTIRIFPLGAQCPLTGNTKPKVVPVKQWKPTGRLILLGGQCPLVRPTTLNRGTMPADPQGNNTPVEYNLVCFNHYGIDDYSRFTWVKFLRSKNETLKFVVKLLKQLQVGLNKTVRNVRIDNGLEFVNKDLTAYYESVDITHEKTIPRTPQQNGVVERRNRTLMEAARTMLIFSKAPMFLWAEAIATACYTQN